jgi:peptide/nickel transport system substrate-binding protein
MPPCWSVTRPNAQGCTTMQAEFRKTSPFVMLFQQTEVAAYRSNVDGLKIGPTSDSTYLFGVSKR